MNSLRLRQWQLSANSVEKQCVAGAESDGLNVTQAPFLAGFVRLLRCRKDPSRALALPIPCRAVLCQFAEVLGGCGEEEFIVCTAWAA